MLFDGDQGAVIISYLHFVVEASLSNIDENVSSLREFILCDVDEDVLFQFALILSIFMVIVTMFGLNYGFIFVYNVSFISSAPKGYHHWAR